MPLTRRKLLNALIPASIISFFTTKDAFSDVTLGKKSKVDIQNENIISQTDTSKTLRILDSLDGASKVRARNNETVEQSLQTLDSKMLKLEKFVFKDDFEVAEQYNIPGDFTDLQEAINHLSNRNASANKYIILNIQSGYRISSGVKVQHGDYSRFYIQSEDSIVYIADDFEGVSGPDGKNTITDGTVILAYHARGPVLGCIIDGRSIARTLYLALGGAYGWSDRLQSSTEEKPNKIKISGGKNFRHSTFEAQEGSVIICENVIATGCLLNSIYCERNSTIHAEFSDASGSVKAGVMATRGSRVNADTMNVSGCQYGIWASRGAVISASDSTADNCKIYGYYADMSATINAHNTSALNTGTEMPTNTERLVNPGSAYHAYRGSNINACNGKASGSIYGISAITNSKVAAFGVIANVCKTLAAYARYSSTISFDKSTITNSIGRAIMATDGSSISAQGCNVQGGATLVTASSGGCVTVSHGSIRKGITGVYAETGGRVIANGACIKDNREFDVKVNTGGFIIINEASYSSLNESLNTVSSNGIIFG